MIWSLIVGGLIGFIAGAITKKGEAMGIIANIIVGLLGINSFYLRCSNCYCCCIIFLWEKGMSQLFSNDMIWK